MTPRTRGLALPKPVVRYFLAFASPPILVLLAHGIGFCLRPKDIFLVFRYDDYSSRSHTPTEENLLRVFQQHGVPITFAVIPRIGAGDLLSPVPQGSVPLTQRKIDLLRRGLQSGTLEVALHGYSHQTFHASFLPGCDGHYIGEFCGLDRQTQFKKISNGKAFLEGSLGQEITTFVPPWNIYDNTTIDVLEEIGFTALSAGPIGPSKRSSRIRFLPLTARLDQVRRAVESARRTPEVRPIIVVLFHDYEFLDVDSRRGSISFHEFEELLSWVTSQTDVHVVTINDLTRRMKGLSAARYERASRQESLLATLPSPLRNLANPLFYPSSNSLKAWTIKGWLIWTLYYGSLLILSIPAFWIERIAWKRLRGWGAAAGLASLVFLILILIQVVPHPKFTVDYRGPSALTLAVAACLGIWGGILNCQWTPKGKD